MVRLAPVLLSAGLVAGLLVALPAALFQSKELAWCVVGMLCGGWAGPLALLLSPRLRDWTRG